MKWEIQSKINKRTAEIKVEEVINLLFKNRGIKTKEQKEEFINPKKPVDIPLRQVGLKKGEIIKAVRRIEKARKSKEKVVVYGDYDADGICATAILWECLYSLGVDVLPYIPERFSEGYGLNVGSVEKLKTKYPKLKLIITVDNGIVAYQGVEAAKRLGIDVIITDHHLPHPEAPRQLRGKVNSPRNKRKNKLPQAHSIIHTTKTGGAGIAWFLSREIKKQLTHHLPYGFNETLALAAIGTIADQIPLLSINRSLVKFGLEQLRKTKRPGLLELYKEAAIEAEKIGTYEVGFVIAPRLNAMGRLEHAIDSLRLLCTRDKKRSKQLALSVGKINKKRQKIVDEVVLHAKKSAQSRDWLGVIVVSHASYHEGVIGLAASRLVEEYWRPAIVLSKGSKVSKASARSISGFNIIDAIRELDDLLIEAGGHPMAAGFSIETKKIEQFIESLEEKSSQRLTGDLLVRKLPIDLELDFGLINWDLVGKLKLFEPTGMGNSRPTFAAYGVSLVDLKPVGFENKHLKLKLAKKGQVFDAIAFGFGNLYRDLLVGGEIDLVFGVEENVWNGKKTIQLKVKDIKKSEKE